MATKKEENIPTAVYGALKGSGFPFQTAISHVVGVSKSWSIKASEYPWKDADGTDEFLDLVATNGQFYATIECKKTQKETLTFLRPLGISNTGEVDSIRCVHAMQMEDSTRRAELYCEDWSLWPQSHQSEFCVVSTSDTGKSQRLLERDARLLVRATDAYARDFRSRFRPDRDSPLPSGLLFLPVIVTNAPLYSARYKPTDVSLETGRFKANPEEVKSVPWIRFQKAFTSSYSQDLGDRTVFVVNAQSFSQFLDNMELPPEMTKGQNLVHLPKQ